FVEPAGGAEGPGPTPPHVAVRAEVFEKDVALVTPGQALDVASEAFPGKTFAGRVTHLAAALTPETRTLRVRLDIDDPQRELRPGMFVKAKARVPVSGQEGLLRAGREGRRDRTMLDLLAHALAGAPQEGGLAALARSAVQAALESRGLVLAVPELAVVDTGS